MSTDPTRSKTKRERWERDFNSRWQRVESEIRNKIENDSSLDPTNENISSGQQSADFHDMVEHTVENEVMKPMQSRHVRAGSHYTGKQVRNFYEHGLELADDVLREEGLEPPEQSGSDILRQERYNPGFHMDFLEEEYVETYHDLESITNDVISDTTDRYQHSIRGNMTTAVSGTDLSVSEIGGSPSQIAAPAVLSLLVLNRIDKVGRYGTKLIAQAKGIETINDAALNRYAELGIEEVGVDVEEVIVTDDLASAEWETAGDAAVCDECAALEGNIYPIEAIRGSADVGYEVPKPPIHPNCRCFIRPIVSNRHF